MDMSNFAHHVRIYYEDTDAGGVVYNANYVKFLERARTEWLRVQGFEQRELLTQGVGFVVANINMNFKRGARLDDELLVTCKIIEVRSASVIFEQEIVDNNGTKYIEAQVKIACVNFKNMRPMPFPEEFKEVFVK